jgi:hypothetical protein
MRRNIATIALAALALTPGVVVSAASASVIGIHTVRNTNNAGPDSLRRAIDDANSTVGPDEIHFDIPFAGAQVINLVTDLPPITQPVVIDGYTQSDAAPAVAGTPAVLRIVINAANVAYGLDLQTNDSVITGLVVRSAAGPVAAGVTCDNGGICVTGDNNVLRGNYVGVGHAGQVALGNDGDGIHIEGDGNVVGGSDPGDRNVISANHDEGIAIEGAMNVVQGNLIGTDASGTTDLGNTQDGVEIVGDGNAVGGSGDGEGNVIACNGTGVYAHGDDNTLVGNLIGTDINGVLLRANGGGVYILGDHNTVGSAGKGNVISGNGVGVTVESSTETLVQDNHIGTDKTGMVGFAGGSGGIVVDAASTDSTISGNVIAGMLGYGIDLDGDNGTVQRNKIGTNAAGRVAFGNNTGLRVDGNDNLIGGTTTDAGNIISGNVADGVLVESGATRNTFHGNLIGVDVTGFAPLGNGGSGLSIDSSGNTVGGHAAGEANIIAANGGNGVLLESSDTTVEGNLIGVGIDTNGATVPLGNARSGVRINGDANRVGGVDPGAGNVIAANAGYGVDLDTGWDNQIMANTIGTDQGGVPNLGNARSGVRVGGARNVIGSIDPAVKPNIIAFNGGDGVTVGTTGGTSENAIVGNVIVANQRLGIDLNPNGVTANDNNVQDADSGANDLQNHPVILTASTQGTITTVTWTLDSLASSDFRLEFFAVNTCDGSGHGEGQTFLGERLVTTFANGKAASATPTTFRANVGQYVVMTATYVSAVGPPLDLRATSEFSACVLVT